ncbi:arylsulfatase [Paraburkholderia sp. MMS20-SJTR3]|uniref:Arylsulfatase n=1 Tax=Paraburkholderia sejongensis TaxID=2886946 RepID=A0ABS8K1K2_9BURK|nr:arylsulfatase [Paraburkholderia sp. MMS20-SJTR3]MCC8396025.1 arylsulfatase [Paraburkholderia sp. MMS20-SJTR3]
MRIAFLHTIDGNRQVFEHAATELGVASDDLRHTVRVDLREAIERAGTFTPELKQQTRACLLELAADADAVVVTCATLGPVVAEITHSPVPVIRADAALAASAAGSAGNGGKIVVLCAAEAALESNRKLFAAHASEARASVEIVHVPQVWATFRSGETDACYAAIAAATSDAYAKGATVVAFAHPWMAPAAALASAPSEGKRPLDSARAALRVAMQRVNREPVHIR